VTGRKGREVEKAADYRFRVSRRLTFVCLNRLVAVPSGNKPRLQIRGSRVAFTHGSRPELKRFFYR